MRHSLIRLGLFNPQVLPVTSICLQSLAHDSCLVLCSKPLEFPCSYGILIQGLVCCSNLGLAIEDHSWNYELCPI